MSSGDPLWLVHQTGWRATRANRGTISCLGWVIGAGLIVPAVAGTVAAFRDLLKASRPAGSGRRGATPAASECSYETEARLAALVVLMGLLFVYTALAWWRPVTFGNLRYMANAAPAAALLAAAGLHELRGAPRRRGWLVLTGATAIALLLWRHPLFGDFTVLRRTDLFFPAVAVAWYGIYFLPGEPPGPPDRARARAGRAGANIQRRCTFILPPNRRPLRRRPPWCARRPVASVALHRAHPLLAFWLKENLYDVGRFPALTRLDAGATPPEHLLLGLPLRAASDRRDESGVVPGRLDLAVPGGGVASDTMGGGSFSAARPERPAMRMTRAASRGLSRSQALALAAPGGVARARRCAEADPDNALWWRGLAGGLVSIGRRSEAMQALGRAGA